MLPHWPIKALLESTLSCAYFHVQNQFHTNQSSNFIQIKVYKASAAGCGAALMVESIECCRLEIIRFASQCKDDEP
jgi:hypothetical protein